MNRRGKTGTTRMVIGMICSILAMTVVGADQIFKWFSRHSSVIVKLLSFILLIQDKWPLSVTDCLMFTLAAGLPNPCAA